MSRSEYEAGITEFLRTKGVTRCPTACAAPTGGTVADADRAALRSYEDAREVARLQKLRGSGERVPPKASPRPEVHDPYTINALLDPDLSVDAIIELSVIRVFGTTGWVN